MIFPDVSTPYLSDAAAAHHRKQHPLIRAIHGEVIDAAEFFLRQPGSSEGIWVAATGRLLTIDERGATSGWRCSIQGLERQQATRKNKSPKSRDREQQRIGQDLHDSLCQHLVSIARSRRELLRDKLERDRLPEAARAEIIAEMVNEGISQAANRRGLYRCGLKWTGLLRPWKNWRSSNT